MIKGIIFDLDGTLLNTIEDLADSLNQALQDVNHSTYTNEVVQSFIGNGMYRLVDLALNERATQQEIEQVLELFKEHYAKRYTNKTTLYPNMKLVVMTAKERGLKLGVCSNKANKYVQPLIDLHFGSDVFDFVLGEVDYIPRKPDPSMALEVCENLGLKTDECLFVGDSTVDIKTAHAAKMPVCAVTFGFNDEESLLKENPEYIAHDALELKNIIESVVH
jgi:phosphoglycolate phosphatase